MNRKGLAALVLVLFVLDCAARKAATEAPGDPPAPGTASLTVEVRGLESEEGQVALALYDSAESFRKRSGAVAKGWVEPRGGSASWTVERLDPGLYAVAVYHDLNGNGELDRSTLGPPSEPYGFSNDVRGTFGPPKFDKAAVRLGPGRLSIEITLR